MLKYYIERSEIVETNLKLEKKILNISFVGSLIFLISEMVAAYLTGSHAILADCVFDIADLIMIGPFMVLVPLLYKPVTEKRPYGFAQIESLFVLIKYLLLLFIDVVMVIENIQVLFEGGNHVNATAIAIFEIAISVGCIIMYFALKRINKKYSSPSIKAELYIWKLDSYSTMGVGVAFLISLLLKLTPLAFVAPYVDPAIAIALAIILIKEPLEMIWEALKGLVLFAPKKEIRDEISKDATQVLSKYGYYINFFDVIKTGRKYWVDIYIVMDTDTISVSDLKSANAEITEMLNGKYDSIFIELIPDVEKVRKENVEKMQARRQDKIDFVEEKERKSMEKKKSKQQHKQ